MVLAVLCAATVLHPDVVASLPTAPRIVLGAALVVSGCVLAGVSRGRSAPEDRPPDGSIDLRAVGSGEPLDRVAPRGGRLLPWARAATRR